MKTIYTIISILFSTLLTTNFGIAQPLKYGFWEADLQISDQNKIPFTLSFELEDENLVANIYNGSEMIELDSVSSKNDSIYIPFLSFNTYLIFSIDKEEKINGYYVQPDRTKFKRIPFSANYSGKKIPTDKYKTKQSVEGRWKTVFSPESKEVYPAIGKFEQDKNGIVTGTFLTETGDYRFLKGHLKNDQLTLSTFDGSHAFLFKATLEGDSLKGNFYSGKHWQTKWIAERNEEYQLSDPDSITYLVEKKFEFEHKTIDNETYKFPNESTKGKVVIVQIIGTWCPNCLDETNFYLELYDKYHDQGLEIIGVAYEFPATFEEQAERVKQYKEHKNIPYKILIGGQASKDKASEDFNMLNEITSFPTSIILNRSGEIVKIHTGFNGPGTGDIYKEYTKETKMLIEELLQK